MTPKQRRFCDEYLIDLNATQAAIRAGYSEKTAGSTGCENLKKPEIAAYLRARMREKDARLIADQNEVMEYLTRVMRREEKETVVCMDGKTRRLPAPLKDANKAAELLGRRYAMFSDSVIVDGELPTIVDDVDDDPDDDIDDGGGDSAPD